MAYFTGTGNVRIAFKQKPEGLLRTNTVSGLKTSLHQMRKKRKTWGSFGVAVNEKTKRGNLLQEQKNPSAVTP